MSTLRRILPAWLIVATSLAVPCAAQVRAELRGHVTDARTARPVADARVEVAGRTESARSDAEGLFVIRGLEPRNYVIRVRAIGYAARSADVELENGRVTPLDLALDPTPVNLAAVRVRAARDSDSRGQTTFDRRAIEASGGRDVGELLQSVAGLVVTQAGGPGSATHVSIRGSGSSEVLVLVDGAPLNSSITGEADLSRISLDNVERVVVRTGAQSARYGSRALAGVIEVDTRRPMNDASVLLRSGSWGEQNASITAGDTRPLGATRAGASITADYRTLRGDFDYDVPALRGGGTARRLNSDVTSREIAGALALDGDEGAATVRGSAETLRRGVAGSVVQPSTTGREGQQRESGGIDAVWRRRALSWTFVGDATHEGATYIDPAPPFGSQYDDTVRATAVTGSSVVSLGSNLRSVSLGGEARTTDLFSTILAPGTPHWQRVLGAFGGVRLARWLDSGGTRLDFDAAARIDRSSLVSETMVSPRVEARLSRDHVAASASVGSGYAPPSLADQFFHEGVLVRPNPDLRPERTRDDVEGRIGVHDLGAGPWRFSADAAAFRANVDGMILWFPDYRFVWGPSNNQVRRSGWELSGGASLGSDVDVRGTLNRADVVYAGPVLSGQVAYRPKTTGQIAIGTGPRFAHIEVTTRYVGARRTVPGDALNTLDPYWLTDARISSMRSLGSVVVDAAIGIENMLNTPAAMLVDYPFPSRGWTLAVRVRRSDGDRVH